MMESAMEWYWWILAVGLIVAFRYALRFGSMFVESRTGRSNELGPRANLSDLVYFLLVLSIGMFPIWLIPDAHWLVSASFLLAGIVIGLLVTQALFGRKAS
jgi:hypothetical protein